MATDTYLNICKEVHDKLGMQGTFTTVDTSIRYQKLIADLVSQAWRDLQHSRDDFYFLRASKSLTVTAGTQTYYTYVSGGADEIFSSTEVLRFGRWRPHMFLYNYKPLKYVGYDEWQLADRTVSVSKPTMFTINPANDSVIFQNLSANATVTLNYIKSAHVFSANSDVPEVPIVDRDVIMWAGLLACAEEFGNDDAENKATINYEHTLGAFERHQVPSKSIETPSIA